MTKFLRNARSEFTPPRNFSDGGVLESSRMFHQASCASIRPALSVGRGSGFGASAAAKPAGVAGVCAYADDAARLAASVSAASRRLRLPASRRVWFTGAMCDFLDEVT